jgi:hypothetical protein
MPQYNAGEWIGSPCRQFVEVYGKEVLAAAKKKHLCGCLPTFTMNSNKLSVAGLASTCRYTVKITLFKHKLFNTVNAPAASLATVHEVMNQSLKIMEQL